jgi:hypothetical protein
MLRLWEHIDFLSEGGGEFWLDGCLGVEPRVANHVICSKWALWRSLRARGEGGFEGRAPTFFISPCHLPYNWGKSHRHTPERKVTFYIWPSLGCPSAIGWQEELVAVVGRLPLYCVERAVLHMWGCAHMVINRGMSGEPISGIYWGMIGESIILIGRGVSEKYMEVIDIGMSGESVTGIYNGVSGQSITGIYRGVRHIYYTHLQKRIRRIH